MLVRIVIFMGCGKEKIMISKKMEAEINEQINKELYSAYLYLAMANYSASTGLMGFANWMRVQVQEEMAHAMKMYDYVIEPRGNVELTAIDQPSQLTWNSLLDMFEATLKHEQFVTSRIHHLVEVATAEKDYAAIHFLNWFVNEQVEEEAHADELVKKLQFIADDKNAMLSLNNELAARVFVPIATTAE